MYDLISQVITISLCGVFNISIHLQKSIRNCLVLGLMPFQRNNTFLQLLFIFII